MHVSRSLLNCCTTVGKIAFDFLLAFCSDYVYGTSSVDCVTTGSFVLTQYRRVTDGQTDRQTDKRTDINAIAVSCCAYSCVMLTRDKNKDNIKCSNGGLTLSEVVYVHAVKQNGRRKWLVHVCLQPVAATPS